MDRKKILYRTILTGICVFCAISYACPDPPCAPCYSNWPDCDVFCDGQPGYSCCDGSCCSSDCCDDVCCEENQYCCGGTPNELCCEADEICCYYLGPPMEYYCAQPCWEDDPGDTTTCNEDNDGKCTGCKQITPPTCSPYNDYSGLAIKECHDGCPQDWNVSDEICYEVKECFPMLESDSLCIECEGEESCFPVIDIGGGDCETFGECIVQIACDIILTCFQCTDIDTVIETITEETCSCE